MKRKIVYSLIGVALLCEWTTVCSEYRYDLVNWYARLIAPSFDRPPDRLANAGQAAVLADYRQRGYDLHCHSDLRANERMGPFDDYMCWALVKTAFDGIPATQLALFFGHKQLTFWRLELPLKSADRLDGYLSRHVPEGPPRELVRPHPDNDIEPLAIWVVGQGRFGAGEALVPRLPVRLLWM